RTRAKPLSPASREVSSRGPGRGLLVRHPRRPRGGTGVHSRPDGMVASRERRRREEPRHPSREHDAQAARGSRASRRGRASRHDSAVGRDRGRGRSDLGSRAGLRPGAGSRDGGALVTAPFDLARYQDPLTIQRVLLNAKTIAIVGLSGNALRASNFVGFYLRRHGYRVIPVNPREREIFGEKSYASLADVPERVDIVNVFRAPDALPEIATEAVRIGAGCLWCQFGVINEEGARIAEEGGLSVV